MNGRTLKLEDVTRLLSRYKGHKKGIPVSELGIKSWGIIDYARSQGIPIKLDWEIGKPLT